MSQTKRRTKSKLQNDWGERLRSVLVEKGITLRAAAKMAGVSPSVLDSWTASASPSDLLAVRRLSNELRVSFAWLLTGQPENGTSEPLVSHLFEEVPYFEGIARIRIDRLIPRKKDEDDK